MCIAGTTGAAAVDTAPETGRGGDFLLVFVPKEDVSRWPQYFWGSSLLETALPFGEVESISSCLCVGRGEPRGGISTASAR